MAVPLHQICRDGPQRWLNFSLPHSCKTYQIQISNNLVKLHHRFPKYQFTWFTEVVHNICVYSIFQFTSFMESQISVYLIHPSFGFTVYFIHTISGISVYLVHTTSGFPVYLHATLRPPDFQFTLLLRDGDFSLQSFPTKMINHFSGTAFFSKPN